MRAQSTLLTVSIGLSWLMSGFVAAQPDTTNAPAQAPAATTNNTTEVDQLKKQLAEAERKIAELNKALTDKAHAPDPALEGLDSADAGAGNEAVKLWAAKGEKALPRLRDIAFKGQNATARFRAKEAIGQITGQWGSQTDLIWKRSVEEAINPDKPLLVLQLFGSLDEEFC